MVRYRLMGYLYEVNLHVTIQVYVEIPPARDWLAEE